MFTTGITKDYKVMTEFVNSLLGVVDGAVGTSDAVIVRLDRKIGPYEECIWYECVMFYSKKRKRVVLFSVMKSN